MNSKYFRSTAPMSTSLSTSLMALTRRPTGLFKAASVVMMLLLQFLSIVAVSAESVMSTSSSSSLTDRPMDAASIAHAANRNLRVSSPQSSSSTPSNLSSKESGPSPSIKLLSRALELVDQYFHPEEKEETASSPLDSTAQDDLSQNTLNADFQNHERILNPGATAGWYIDWENLYCSQSCPQNSSPTCGGTALPWQHVWSSAEECCHVHLSWQSLDACTKFGHPKNLEELETLEGGLNGDHDNDGGNGSGGSGMQKLDGNLDSEELNTKTSRCWLSGTPCDSMADSWACCTICSEGHCL